MQGASGIIGRIVGVSPSFYPDKYSLFSLDNNISLKEKNLQIIIVLML